MNGFLIRDSSRTGRVGMRIATGQRRRPGASRAIRPGRSSRDRPSGSKGSSNINRGRRFNNTSSRDSHRLGRPRDRLSRGFSNRKSSIPNLGANNTRGVRNMNRVVEDPEERRKSTDVRGRGV